MNPVMATRSLSPSLTLAPAFRRSPEPTSVQTAQANNDKTDSSFPASEDESFGLLRPVTTDGQTRFQVLRAVDIAQERVQRRTRQLRYVRSNVTFTVRCAGLLVLLAAVNVLFIYLVRMCAFAESTWGNLYLRPEAWIVVHAYGVFLSVVVFDVMCVFVIFDSQVHFKRIRACIFLLPELAREVFKNGNV